MFNLTAEFSSKQNQSFQLADEEKQADDKRKELRQQLSDIKSHNYIKLQGLMNTLDKTILDQQNFSRVCEELKN